MATIHLIITFKIWDFRNKPLYLYSFIRKKFNFVYILNVLRNNELHRSKSQVVKKAWY